MGKPSLCAKPSLGKMNKLFTVAGLFAVFLGAVHAGVITAVVPSAISAAPILNATTITACGVRVNWNVPSSNGGKPILHYTIYATGGGTTHFHSHLHERDRRKREKSCLRLGYVAKFPK